MDIVYLIIALIAAAAAYLLGERRAKHRIVLLEAEKDSAVLARIEAEKQCVRLETELQASRQRIEDWQKTGEQFKEAAKASLLEAGTALSSKLLDDHKRESETARQETEKRIRETTDAVMKDYKKLSESTQVMHSQLAETRRTADALKQSLLSPGGAGSLSEITLENMLATSGLVKNQDYYIQYWFRNAEDQGLRPDALVMAPDGNVLVIDSKASKFFHELVEEGEKAGTDGQRVRQIEEQLRQRMHAHLKDLAKRDYRSGVEKHLKELGRTDPVSHIAVFMFLPSDGALDRLRRIDPEFLDRAGRDNIFPVGPTSLKNYLLQAKLVIAHTRQERNYDIIIEEVKSLIGNLARLHELAQKMGKGLQGAVQRYDEFAASFNKFFLARVRKFDQLGVSGSQQKSTTLLTRYQMIDSAHLIEGESEEPQDETFGSSSAPALTVIRK